MKKDGNIYVPESMDPYSEFDYTDDRVAEEPTTQVEVIHEQPQPMQRLTENVDSFFDGVDMVFDLINHVNKRLSGGPNARRRTRNK